MHGGEIVLSYLEPNLSIHRINNTSFPIFARIFDFDSDESISPRIRLTLRSIIRSYSKALIRIKLYCGGVEIFNMKIRVSKLKFGRLCNLFFRANYLKRLI